MSKRQRRVLWATAGGVVALVAALLLWPAQAGSGLDEARARWNGRPFQAYRIALTQETRRGSCDQEIVADDERAGRGLSNTCGQPATWTVTRLFNWIAELERSPNECFPDPNMCACQARTYTSVAYDPALGYPTEIVYEWRKQPNLGRAAYWRSLFDQSFPGCNKDGTGGPVVVRIALTPEP